MDYAEAIRRLCAHDRGEQLPDSTPCLGFQAYLFLRGDAEIESVRAAFRDVLACLEVVNVQVNGAIPSELANADKVQLLDRWTVYAVADILQGGWDIVVDAATRESSTEFAELHFVFWALSFAWSSILAGDIDCLREELKFESVARGLHSFVDVYLPEEPNQKAH